MMGWLEYNWPATAWTVLLAVQALPAEQTAVPTGPDRLESREA
jgi:hypothetical protein